MFGLLPRLIFHADAMIMVIVYEKAGCTVLYYWRTGYHIYFTNSFLPLPVQLKC